MDGSGTMYFTDSGVFGDTGLHSPKGSLFRIANTPVGQILLPIAYESLAYPWGVATSPDGKMLYVAETMSNRVIRYFQRPAEAYHGSVFIQLSGRVGPSALACDQQGSLYVAHYDVAGGTKEGVVYIVSRSGEITSSIAVPGPEITGLSVRYVGQIQPPPSNTTLTPSPFGTARTTASCSSPSAQRKLCTILIYRSS